MTRRKGFTLVELLVVVAIIAILAAVLLGSLSWFRQVMIRTECATNLSKISKVFAAYAKEQGGQLPCFGYTEVTEKRVGVGATPSDRHLMMESLVRLGGTAKVFCCPAHIRREDIDGGSPLYNWELRHWKQASWSSNKWYYTPGYIWLAYTSNFTRHTQGNVIPNRWGSWSRFTNGALLPTRTATPGNPPIAADLMQIYQGKLSGFWHDPDRESASTWIYSEEAQDVGGGGHTLFLNGNVVWADWGDLEGLGPAYEAQDDKYTYFLLRASDE